ncbi:MAG: CDP-diacylglycerol--glycerol-3-phosphate 3-phosphatidyltransferase [Angelakisella sp.]
MNLPNKLTMLRMALIPVFLLCMMWEFPHHYLLALIIFAGASFTDMLDGQIARARGLVTNFGKFMDPLADKLLVMSALVCFTQVKNLPFPAVIVVIILAREFAVTALRTLAADGGVVIAADKWGKIKTVSQMVWICYTLAFLWISTDVVGYASDVFIAIWFAGLATVVVTTIGSGINYLVKNRALFMNSK